MTEYVIAAGIGIVYPVFFSKLSDQVFGLADIDNQRSQCYSQFPVPVVSDITGKAPDTEFQACYEKWNDEYQKADFKKYLLLLFMGLIGIMVSGFIGANSGWATKIGIAFGGLITFVYAVLGWWNLYSENVKLALLGLSMVVFVLLSARLYKARSVSDLLTWNFN